MLILTSGTKQRNKAQNSAASYIRNYCNVSQKAKTEG